MLKFENTAQIGDTIKAFDFEPMPGREDMYLVGEVIAKGDMMMETDDGRFVSTGHGYTVKVTESNSGSANLDAKRKGTEMYVPYEMMFDFDNRVSLAEAV